MDELKLLIEMVSNLPTLAVWVLVGYLVYKVAVIGSIYGLLHTLIDRAYKYGTRVPHAPHPTQLKIGGNFINHATADDANNAIREFFSSQCKSGYIHQSDVDKLRTTLAKKATA